MLATNQGLSAAFPLGSLVSRSTQVVELRFIWVSSLTAILLSRFILDLRGSNQSSLDPHISVSSSEDYSAVELADLSGPNAAACPEISVDERRELSSLPHESIE
ncbi:hypothetical protein EIP86_002632 [Pleurotus ostreatoroseus]|nr:hypothetical protein EIP86_002632 [Pleurotus ostreatoroseus]